jgi:hypothetical protein
MQNHFYLNAPSALGVGLHDDARQPAADAAIIRVMIQFMAVLLRCLKAPASAARRESGFTPPEY